MAEAPPLPAAAAAAATTTNASAAAAATTSTTDVSKGMESLKLKAHEFCVAPCPVKGSKQPNPHTERDKNVLVALHKVSNYDSYLFYYYHYYYYDYIY